MMMPKFSFSSSSAPAVDSSSRGVAARVAAIKLGSISKVLSSGNEAISKSVSGAIATLPSLVLSRKEDDFELHIEQIASLLRELRLQIPTTHTGLVIAISSATVSPLSHPDVKFTWYRVGTVAPDSPVSGKLQASERHDNFVCVDESQRSWYAPTVDDIGLRICVKCEDTFKQGLSRYLEVSGDLLLSNMYFM
jgi:hypothetical protein